MRLNEFSSSLNKYKATVKVEGNSVRTIIHAESQSHARMLLGKMFGKDNVQSITSESKINIDEIEFLLESAIGNLYIGDIKITIDSHAIEQVYLRKINPNLVDSLLKKLPKIQDQLLQMTAASKVWVKDSDSGLSIGLRRNNDRTIEFQLKTAFLNRTYDSETPEIVI
jgi:hypothetical protein